jgi:hypothetical protein
MEIDIKNGLIGCIPFADLNTPPVDQKDCTLEACPCCDKLMWLSARKKEFIKTNNNYMAYCFRCVIEQLGETIEVMDISEMQ